MWSNGSGWEPMAGCCKQGDASSGSIKGRKYDDTVCCTNKAAVSKMQCLASYATRKIRKCLKHVQVSTPSRVAFPPPPPHSSSAGCFVLCARLTRGRQNCRTSAQRRLQKQSTRGHKFIHRLTYAGMCHIT